MSTSCDFPGHPETYGLGIRISFYVFWYSIPLSHWVARSETKALRSVHSLLIAGTFLGLIIQTVNDNNKNNNNVLKPAEIYITLLLCFGGFLYLVPLYVWRLLTCCKIPFDPSRYARVQTGPIFALLNFLLLVALALFQLWFWFDVAGGGGLQASGGAFGVAECPQYGFFFTRVRLNQKGFVVGNILLTFAILAGCVVVAVLTVIKMMSGGWLREVQDDDGRSVSITSSEWDEMVDVGKVRETALQEFDTFMHLLTTSTALSAIELTIYWNPIPSSVVNTIPSPSQSIPLMLGVGALLRVVYIALVGDLDERYRIRRGKSVFGGGWDLSRLLGVFGGGGAAGRRRRRRRRRRSSSSAGGGGGGESAGGGG